MRIRKFATASGDRSKRLYSQLIARPNIKSEHHKTPDCSRIKSLYITIVMSTTFISIHDLRLLLAQEDSQDIDYHHDVDQRCSVHCTVAHAEQGMF